MRLLDLHRLEELPGERCLELEEAVERLQLRGARLVQVRHLVARDVPVARQRRVHLAAVLGILGHHVAWLLVGLDVLARLGELAQRLDAAALNLRDLLVLLRQLDLPHVLDPLVPVRLARLRALAQTRVEDRELLLLQLENLLLAHVPVAQLLLAHHLAPQRQRLLVRHRRQRRLELALLPRALDHLDLVEASGQARAVCERGEGEDLRLGRVGRHDVGGRVRVGLRLRLAKV